MSIFTTLFFFNMVQSLLRSDSFRVLFNSPELSEVQRSGFHLFLKKGITEELSKISCIPIKNAHFVVEILVDASNFRLVAPENSYRDCILKMKSYTCKLYVQTRILFKDKISEELLYQTQPEWVFLADLPMMTRRGHFIINGSPRIIVHQVGRAPGVYFKKVLKVKNDVTNKARFYGDIIPRKGVWVRLQINKKGEIDLKLKKSKKVRAEMVQKCLELLEKDNSPLSSLQNFVVGSQTKQNLLFARTESKPNSKTPESNYRTNFFSSVNNPSFNKNRLYSCTKPVNTQAKALQKRTGAFCKIFADQTGAYKNEVFVTGLHRHNKNLVFVRLCTAFALVRASSKQSFALLHTVKTLFVQSTAKEQALIKNLFYFKGIKVGVTNKVESKAPLFDTNKNNNKAGHIKSPAGISSGSLSANTTSYVSNKVVRSFVIKYNSSKFFSTFTKTEKEAFKNVYTSFYKNEIQDIEKRVSVSNKNLVKTSSLHAQANKNKPGPNKTGANKNEVGPNKNEVFVKAGLFVRPGLLSQAKLSQNIAKPLAIKSNLLSANELPIESKNNSILETKLTKTNFSPSSYESQNKPSFVATRALLGSGDKKKIVKRTNLSNNLKKIREYLYQLFKKSDLYDLGFVGRDKINTKFGISVKETQLTALDIKKTINWLSKLRAGKEEIDDIDHSQNRRVRTSSELIQTQFEVGITRLKNGVLKRVLSPSAAINIKGEQIKASFHSKTYAKQNQALLLEKNGYEELTKPRLIFCTKLFKHQTLTYNKVMQKQNKQSSLHRHNKTGTEVECTSKAYAKNKTGAYKNEVFVSGLHRQSLCTAEVFVKAGLFVRLCVQNQINKPTLFYSQTFWRGNKQNGANKGKICFVDNCHLNLVFHAQSLLLNKVIATAKQNNLYCSIFEYRGIVTIPLIPSYLAIVFVKSHFGLQIVKPIAEVQPNSDKKQLNLEFTKLHFKGGNSCFVKQDVMPVKLKPSRAKIQDLSSAGAFKNKPRQNKTGAYKNEVEHTYQSKALVYKGLAKTKFLHAQAKPVQTEVFVKAGPCKSEAFARLVVTSVRKQYQNMTFVWPEYNSKLSLSLFKLFLTRADALDKFWMHNQGFTKKEALQRPYKNKPECTYQSKAGPNKNEVECKSKGLAKTKWGVQKAPPVTKTKFLYAPLRFCKRLAQANKNKVFVMPVHGFLNAQAFASNSVFVTTLFTKHSTIYPCLQRAESIVKEQKSSISTQNVKRPLNDLASDFSASEWFSTKPINGALREFFSSSPLSQYMDQTNPLAEITHKRRISSLGAGGVSRESAGMTIRGIHPTHYGRICPIETPEGKNAGLVNSLAFYAKVNNQGFIETPYYQVIKGQVQHELGFSFYSAGQESRKGLSIAPNDIKQSKSKLLASNISTVESIPVRIADNLLDLFKKKRPSQVNCIGISPVQILSVATSLIPFLEHNDANRALMGSNMQRQAVSLMSSERPLVGTGLEAKVLAESGHLVQSKVSGFISNVSAHQVIVERLVFNFNRNNALFSNSFITKQSINRNDHLDKKPNACTKPCKNDVFARLFVKGELFVKTGPKTFNNIVKQEQASVNFNWSIKKQNNNQGGLKKNFTKLNRTISDIGVVFFRPLKAQTKQSLLIEESLKTTKAIDKSDFKHNLKKKNSMQTLALQKARCTTGTEQKAVHRHNKNKPECTSLADQSFALVRAFLCKPVTKTKFLYAPVVQKQSLCMYNNKTEPFIEFVRLFDPFTNKKVALSPVIHSITTFSRSNQETCLTQKPLVEEGDWVQKGDMLSDCSAGQKGELSVGKNMFIAYIPWQGYNFEDAIVISDRLVKEQLYTSLHIERYTVIVNDFKDKVVDTNEWFTGKLPGVDSKKRAHLQKSGLPRVGAILKEGDILVGKIKYSKKKPATPHEKLVCDILGEHNFSVQNTSLYVPKGVHEARVLTYKIKKRFDKALKTGIANGVPGGTKNEVGQNKVLQRQSICTPYGKVKLGQKQHNTLLKARVGDSEANLRPAGAPKVVHIFLGEKRNIQIGDKMSGRHGNKGIVSTILPKQDMPYLADGSPIDILLNPLGVPSRMNVGQVFECLLGLASTYLHQNFKITAFDELYGVEASQSLVFLKLYQARLQSGQNWLFQINFPGKTRLTDGRSGECLDQWVTVGRAYMLKLIHMVNEKIHARAIGPYALVTQQPLKGRAHKGGQRLGEMEVWAIEGFGAAYILQELLTKKSDDSIGRKELLKAMLPKPASLLDFIDPFGQSINTSTQFKGDNILHSESLVTFNSNSALGQHQPFAVLGQPDIFKVLICELQALCLDVGVYSIKTESFQRQFVGVFE